jgi:predicted aldo/keto reductase-like oxidoreductase
MPNMELLAENTAAALDKTRLSARKRELLGHAAKTTAAGYCAGCTRLCEPAVAAAVPIGRVMRYLMYSRSYGSREDARRRFQRIDPQTRARMAGLDYAVAEARCPQGMPIGRLMREALTELA